jgi:hypothetical protein
MRCIVKNELAFSTMNDSVIVGGVYMFSELLLITALSYPVIFSSDSKLSTAARIDAGDYSEIVEMRSANSSSYHLDDGSVVSLFNGLPTNYWNGQKYIPIDSSFSQDADSFISTSGAYLADINKANPTNIKFDYAGLFTFDITVESNEDMDCEKVLVSGSQVFLAT